ncbi:MAG: DUF58 domain-containing protein [Thermodesulfovibrionales bacterium]|nr:DUF58 domain-containing protein [Thermodesulfovibrionales bacterium]
MAISGFIGRRNIQRLDVEILTPDEIYVNTKTPIRIKVINNKSFLPSFLIRVLVFDQKTLLPFIDKKSSSYRYTEGIFHKRGNNKIDNISVCSVFPFNFFIRCRGIKKGQTILVFPQPLICPSLSANTIDANKHKGETSVDNIGFEADLLSIRNYIIGDPLKYIHWKASAKTDKLKTKELSSLETEPVIIDLDSLPFDIETRLSCATYLINQFYRAKIPFGLKIGEEVFEPDFTLEHKLKLLKILALYEGK